MQADSEAPEVGSTTGPHIYTSNAATHLYDYEMPNNVL
jgi:hypothetical protein